MRSRARELSGTLDAWAGQGFHKAYVWFGIAVVAALVALAAGAPSDPWWSPWTLALIFAFLGSFELTKRLVEIRRRRLVAAGAAASVQPMSNKETVVASLAVLLCATGVANLFWTNDLSHRVGGAVLLAIGVYAASAALRRLRGPGSDAGS